MIAKIFAGAKRLVPVTILALGGVAGSLTAQVNGSLTYERLKFLGNQGVVESSTRLPAKAFNGLGAVVIRGIEGRHCLIEVPPTSYLEGLDFIVKTGGELRITGSHLRRCRITLEAGARLALDSSALEKCELNSNVPSNASSGTPSCRLTNCVIQGGAWLVEANRLGLEMIDCVVRDQTTKNYQLYTGLTRQVPLRLIASRPSIRYTKFENCRVNPSLFLMITQCSFENCESTFAPGRAVFDGMGPAMALPKVPDAVPATSPGEPAAPAAEHSILLRWANSVPAVLPPAGNGLAFQLQETPLAGGCTVAYKMEETGLTLEGSLAASAPEDIHAFFNLSPAGSPAMAGTGGATGQSPTNLPINQVKLRQAHINGLLVMPLESGKAAGQVSRMNITVLPGGPYIRFSQPVGDDMHRALREVQKYMTLRHMTSMGDVDIQISFEEKYSDKDGPSAAVACGLLLEACITGKEWDPTFAVTGDMNADGSVQPVGGVSAKIRGATRGTCRLVAVPARNESAISDILVADGPGPLVGIHIFGLSTFEQATALANPVRSAALQDAVNEFEVIRSVATRDPRQTAAILRTPQAAARLQAILEKAPHSLSAKYLLMFAQGRQPATLSIGGSIEAADASAIALVNALKNDFKGNVNMLAQDELGGAMNRLRNLRPKLDRRVWPYVDSLVDYGEIVRGEILNPSRTALRFNQMAARARQAGDVVAGSKKALLADPQVIEDLGL